MWMDSMDWMDTASVNWMGWMALPSMLSFDAIWMDWMDPASADWIDWMALPHCYPDGLDGPCHCGPDGLGGAPSVLLE